MVALVGISYLHPAYHRTALILKVKLPYLNFVAAKAATPKEFNVSFPSSFSVVRRSCQAVLVEAFYKCL